VGGAEVGRGAEAIRGASVGAPEGGGVKFRDVPALTHYDALGARVHGDRITLATTGYVTLQEARALRDWLTQALPCEHRGARRGTWSVNEPLVMRCDICGEEVPGYWTVPSGWVV